MVLALLSHTLSRANTRIISHFRQMVNFRRSGTILDIQRCSSHNATRDNTYDYIIVGAGSAGCVLANRLSAEPNNEVLLVEAGKKDTSWMFHMPAALMYTLCDPSVNWCFYTTPQKHVNGRSFYWPRGKVWGGCSSHNAMVYVRGHAYDFDRWHREGATGWSYADCLPYFKRSETFELGEDDYRGGSGPLAVSRGKTNNPLHAAFIEAGQQAGYPYTPDSNGFQQEGFGPYDMNIDKGKRSSTSQAYLIPVLKRSNLHTETQAVVNRVLFDGKKAVGVEIKQRGVVRKLFAAKEVILSAGAINTPQILMLSGVGDPDTLKRFDIPIIADLPGVGKNLQDHLDFYFQFECTKKITLYRYQWKFPWNMVRTGVQWFLTHSGDAATAHLESGAFIRSQPGIPHPDVQFHFLPSVVIDHGQKLGHCHAYQIHISPLRPTSAGHVTIQSRDPEMPPLMDANYLATDQDRADYRRMLRLAREILMQEAFAEFRGREIQPGAGAASDEDLDEAIRQKCDSAYHPSCTCKIGPDDDRMSVVDPQCRVYGLDHLRVVDASVMPSIVSGNINAAVVMIGEKAADHILDNEMLPKSKAPVWSPETLETQRGH
ncbi:hypothetical protein LSH36_4g21009 [Paralvinella palmiformis]|uniref:Glucose-methanol-choline oxidoreductase N-terminal domain-containing protein n=1 Tax=Paralvinella palmiformis TaxID=53620 RepID=A0AAD9KF38_9ANNE|nr:hypothetical protein LSH36_4g21009 [Paralvinella palmiformis]